MSEQITTITFFRYSGLRQKIRGFGMMPKVHHSLSNVNGLTFYRMMGSGSGIGFTPVPDWSVYSLLQVWENEIAADGFLSESELMAEFRNHSSEIHTVYLKNISAGGAWGGANPFLKSGTLDPDQETLAVITRARVKSGKLFSFWRYVPTSEQDLKSNPGLIFTKGIGETPILEMATFSIWRDLNSVKRFAYEGKGHADGIRMAREGKWFKEDLFSRFQPYRSAGTWNGKDLLSECK
jgi:hypothetical protein